MLLAGRLFQGLGAALTVPAGISIITHIFPEGPKRNRALGIYSATGAIGFSLGLVISSLDWRWIFFLNLPIAIGVLILSIPMIPSSRAPDQTGFDFISAITGTGVLLVGVYAITEIPNRSWTDPHVLVTGTVAFGLLGAFILRERGTETPLIPSAVVRPRSTKIAVFGSAALSATVLNLLFFGTQYLQSLRGYSALVTGLAFLPLGIPSIIVSTKIAGRLVSRYGMRPVLAFGLVLDAIGAAALTQLPVNGGYWMSFFPGILLIGLGFGFIYTAATIGAVFGVDEQYHGIASALQQTAFEIASGIGLALYISVAALFTDFGGHTGTPATFVNGFNTAMLIAAISATAATLATLTLQLGIGAESSVPRSTPDAPTPERTEHLPECSADD